MNCAPPSPRSAAIPTCTGPGRYQRKSPSTGRWTGWASSPDGWAPWWRTCSPSPRPTAPRPRIGSAWTSRSCSPGWSTTPRSSTAVGYGGSPEPALPPWCSAIGCACTRCSRTCWPTSARTPRRVPRPPCRCIPPGTRSPSWSATTGRASATTTSASCSTGSSGSIRRVVARRAEAVSDCPSWRPSLRAHGGVIRASHTPGGGLTMTVLLPQAPEPSLDRPEAADPRATAADSRAGTVSAAAASGAASPATALSNALGRQQSAADSPSAVHVPDPARR